MGSAITHLHKALIMTEIILKGRLDGRQRNRLKGLFDMMYSTRELAEEIGISIDRIYYVYVPLGCPLERDERKHIFINGKAFAEWYSKVYVKIHIKDNETFCKGCKTAVAIYKPRERRKGRLVYLLSQCPNCGRNLTKIISAKRGDNDK
jgi:RNase P subunit RPR2